MNDTQIKNFAKDIRINAVKAVSRSRASHIAAAFSVADIIAVLYGAVMNYDAQNPKSDKRDIFVLSKGHAGVALYCALARAGFFPETDLENYYTFGSLLSGHVSHKVPGVEVSTGALGHGLGLGVGYAYSFKVDNKPNRVFVVVGDGECNEGSVWEAVMLAAQLKLDNLYIIVDRNNMQALGKTDSVLNMGDLSEKFAAFGCNTVPVDGHDVGALRRALTAKSKGKPTAVIAKTVKGKGVSFMENNNLWHYRNPNEDELKKALAELERCDA